MKDFSNPAYAAYVCAYIADKTYLDYDRESNPFEGIGFEVLEFFNKGGAQGYLSKQDNVYVLSFRGTEPDQFNDLAADLNALPDDAEAGGFVHDGFQNEVLDIYEDILSALAKHLFDSDAEYFFVTGHSLGAAMATIASSKLQDECHIDSLYTFGSPRCGNKKFIESCTFPHYRYVNNNDIVTRVPPVLLFYCHHGELMYFNRYGVPVKYNKWQEICDKLVGIISAWIKLKPFDGLADHAMGAYVANCKKAAGL